jgi:uncharacterized protein
MNRKDRVSVFGEYRNFTAAAYDGYERRSDYLKIGAGTMLAYDLLLPTKKGLAASGPLPVLFKYTPYLRTFKIFDEKGKNLIAGLFAMRPLQRALLRLRYLLAKDAGRYMDPVFRSKWLKTMLDHGYAVIVVERPGTGASYGMMNPEMGVGGREAGEIIDWIVSQPWCDGKVGMFGDSFQAMIQYAAAAQGRKALKAIMPASSALEAYDSLMNRGGIYNKAFGAFFKWAIDFMESEVIAPVDRDVDGALMSAARAERESALGSRVVDAALKFPFRDDLASDGRQHWRDRADLYPFLDRINGSGTAVYLSVGWFDVFTQDAFLWFANLKVPKRLAVRPLDHSGAESIGADLDYGAEALRWFDRWLKGVDNGIDKEPAVYYYEMGRDPGWRSSESWPPEGLHRREFFVSAKSALGPAESEEGFDELEVDYSTTTGTRSRWTAVNWEMEYPDMRENDAKSLTYTTEPLEEDELATGSPIARLWLAADAPELDLFAYLEEVDARGGSKYVTEGELRLTHRRLGEAPYDCLGLPYHSHRRADFEPIPAGLPFQVELALIPTSYRFAKGNRIRIAIAFADADNFETPRLDPAPRARLLRGPAHPSSISLALGLGPGPWAELAESRARGYPRNHERRNKKAIGQPGRRT